MLKALTPAWIHARLYHLLSPLAALLLVGVVNHFSNVVQAFEYVTVNLRFKARAAFDPPADPRLLFVTIDEFSLDNIGKWPWSRGVEADFLKQIGNAGLTPAVVTFDIMFTEDTNKLDKFKAPSAAGESDDQQLGDALGLFPAVTGALTIDPPTDKAIAESLNGLLSLPKSSMQREC